MIRGHAICNGWLRALKPDNLPYLPICYALYPSVNCGIFSFLKCLYSLLFSGLCQERWTTLLAGERKQRLTDVQLTYTAGSTVQVKFYPKI